MRKCVLCITLLCATLSFAQSKPFKISGTLISEDKNVPLESATVYLERVKDSSLVTYTISDKNGNFILDHKTKDKSLNLFISYLGYQLYFQTINVDQSESKINLKTIYLKPSSNTLEEVVITSQAPITIKKDTLEFNVNSFKTKKNATVEDLLKKLPGIEIDDDGKIKINGKTVDNVLVNGKPFFGNDPAIATRNLDKDIIKKVQITDTRTKAEVFTGEKGNTDSKTINLTLKQENNKGAFGSLDVGIGANKRYEFGGKMNLFDNDKQFSILAGGNNINSPGFGSTRRNFGDSYSSGRQGINTSKNAGVNYTDDLGEKIKVYANYFYTESSFKNNASTQRENILPGFLYSSASNSKSLNDNNNHNANLGFEIKITPTLLINITPSFSFFKNNIESQGDEESLNVDNTLINQSNSSSNSEILTRNINNEMSITKRLGDKGAFIRYNINNSYNTTKNDSYLVSETTIFGGNSENISRDLFTDEKQKEKHLSTSMTYRLPIKSKELLIDFKYNYEIKKQEDEKFTFDFDDNNQGYTQLNEDLSTDFHYIDRKSTSGIKLTFEKEKWSTSFETNYVLRTLENKDLLRPNLSLKRNFKALELRSNFRYQLSPKSSLRASYSLVNTPPNLSYLQPFNNVTNPLNTIIGNPNLEPTNNHRAHLSYNAFNFQKGTGFYSFVSANFINNRTVSKATVDENLVRNTTYANVDGSYLLNAVANFSKSVKMESLGSFKYTIGIEASIDRFVNFTNDIQYASKNTSLIPTAKITLNWENIMEVSPNYKLSFTKNKFYLDTFENQEFLSHNIGLQTTTFVPKKLEWRNDISYNYNLNVTPSFQKSVWFWNATLAYSILKDKGELTLKVYDLLNQNSNARRTATESYIQDSQGTVLEQYFMLTFSWKFGG